MTLAFSETLLVLSVSEWLSAVRVYPEAGGDVLCPTLREIGDDSVTFDCLPGIRNASVRIEIEDGVISSLSEMQLTAVAGGPLKAIDINWPTIEGGHWYPR